LNRLPPSWINKRCVSLNIHTDALHIYSQQTSQGGAMDHLMQLAEVLRDTAEETSTSEIEPALDLCTGFADRVSRERKHAAEDLESLGQSIATKYSGLPN
jgi:hypothetical protein